MQEGGTVGGLGKWPPPSPATGPGPLLSPWLAHHPSPTVSTWLLAPWGLPSLHRQEEGTGLPDSLPGGVLFSSVSWSQQVHCPASLPRTSPDCPPCGSLPLCPAPPGPAPTPLQDRPHGPAVPSGLDARPTGALGPSLIPQGLPTHPPTHPHQPGSSDDVDALCFALKHLLCRPRGVCSLGAQLGRWELRAPHHTTWDQPHRGIREDFTEEEALKALPSWSSLCPPGFQTPRAGPLLRLWCWELIKHPVPDGMAGPGHFTPILQMKKLSSSGCVDTSPLTGTMHTGPRPAHLLIC